MEKNIVLCGFMGCGKTTVGRLLAQTLERPFSDIDEIVRRDGREISEIFAQDGEEEFRRLEHEACRKLALEGGRIIAPGGGALLYERNLSLLRSSGVILFLDASLQAIRRRLTGDRSRPLLLREGEAERLFEERRPVYLSISDGRIPADGHPEAVVSSILEWLERHR